jgi:DNA-binding GntR family transcriptional regulator
MQLKSRNISEQAYHHIRESLLRSGAYVGQKIPHQDLGQKLGISHTPLREALFRLVAEGLLEHKNYKGFYVPAITIDEARELYETREVIEPFLVEKTARLMNDALAKKFNNLLKTYKALMTEHYNRKRNLTDKKFHLEIAHTAGNKILSQVLNQLYDKLIFKSPVERISQTRVEEAVQEHYRILELLIAGDGKAAAKEMKQHIQKQREYVINNILNKQNGMPSLNPLFPKKKAKSRA